ncbi:glutathione S-transferase family protein [Halovulum dunhuangense]|uniref:Glutathione S-transferase family protein n=1 Tax=Halovulum dunhuangense TaxID=1505036 RepID=A0A849L4F4_9RHOB|nr:glutathione S-transferase family protein [Halovulum dunhuangense]NNU81031.1 glutathione S-transferase family protein [Halovulum dunhuangense]
MATLYHAPRSRSSSVLALIDELGADIDICEVTIPRQDGTGGPDPRNPHPDGKVPYLVDGDERIHERGAIMLHLTDSHPKARLGPRHGEAGRGAYLSWLFYYQGVMEPVIILHWAQLSHPALTATLRDFDAMILRLTGALEHGPYLLGDRFSAADILCSSPFLWFPEMLPDNPVLVDWVGRCAARPSIRRVQMRERQEPGLPRE